MWIYFIWAKVLEIKHDFWHAPMNLKKYNINSKPRLLSAIVRWFWWDMIIVERGCRGPGNIMFGPCVLGKPRRKANDYAESDTINNRKKTSISSYSWCVKSVLGPSSFYEFCSNGFLAFWNEESLYLLREKWKFDPLIVQQTFLRSVMHCSLWKHRERSGRTKFQTEW